MTSLTATLLLVSLFTFATTTFVYTDRPTASALASEPVEAPSGLLSWWPSEEYAFDIIGENHANLKKGVTYDTGKVGKAFRFDGVDDYVWTPGKEIDDVQQLTLETWVYLHALPDRIQRFVTLSPPGDERAVLRYSDFNDYAGQLHFYMRIGVDVYTDFTHILVPNVLYANTWHHVAGTYDGSYMRLYLDGVEVASQAISGPVAIGEHHGVRLSSPDEPLDGLLDEVSIYDRALSAKEIHAIYIADEAGKRKPQEVTIDGDVTVPAGATCTVSSDLYINGNVEVLEGGVLEVQGQINGDIVVSDGALLVTGKINGNIEVQGDSQITVNGGIIDGSIDASSLGAAGAEIYLGPYTSSVGGIRLNTLFVLDGPVTVKGDIIHNGDGLGIEFLSSNGGSARVEGDIILQGTEGQEIDITSGTGHTVKGDIICERPGAADPSDWDGNPGIIGGELIGCQEELAS